MSKKRETKSTVSTSKGIVDIKVIVDFTPEDLIEHMCKCALAEIALGTIYDTMPNKCVLDRGLKKMLISRKN